MERVGLYLEKSQFSHDPKTNADMLPILFTVDRDVAIRKLIINNLFLVQHITEMKFGGKLERVYNNLGLDYGDVFSTGVLGLTKAVNHPQTLLESEFIEFCKDCINREIADLVERNSDLVKLEVLEG